MTIRLFNDSSAVCSVRATITRAFQMGVAVIAMIALSACATTPSATSSPDDPFEPVNRAFFRFNTILDEGILLPVAKAYRFVVPRIAREGVTNFFGNLDDMYSMANNVLQLRPLDAGQNLIRVSFNTVFGFGGLMDIASQLGIEKRYQDFGLTLGHWGVPSGPYLMLPFLGPRTLRDVTNDGVLLYAAPIIHILHDWKWRLVLGYDSIISERANLIDTGDALEGAMLDSYAQVRDAYLQQRQFLLTGKVDYDYGDYDGSDYDTDDEIKAKATNDESDLGVGEDYDTPLTGQSSQTTASPSRAAQGDSHAPKDKSAGDESDLGVGEDYDTTPAASQPEMTAKKAETTPSQNASNPFDSPADANNPNVRKAEQSLEGVMKAEDVEEILE